MNNDDKNWLNDGSGLVVLAIICVFGWIFIVLDSLFGFENVAEFISSILGGS